MTSLSTALHIATNGLAVSSGQTAIASRNVTNAGEDGYTRKSAALASLVGGGLTIASYRRSADSELLERLFDAGSSNAGRQATLNSLEAVSAIVGDPEDEASVAAALGRLQSALRGYEADPANALAAASAVGKAVEFAGSLNRASEAVQGARLNADREIAQSVGRVTSLLQQFKVANDSIVRGEGSARDLTEALDERDRVLKSLSLEFGIHTVTRPGNDVAIYLDSGVTLFDKVPRAVTFAPTQIFTASTTANAVYVDGVAVTEPNAPMAVRSGRIQALSAFRDGSAVTAQAQLDELARGVIEAFAEHDQGTPPALPDRTGLFVYSGAPAIPAPGTLVSGLAAGIRVNSLADPARGGQPRLIRDGGFNGAAYVSNSSGNQSFSSRLTELLNAMDAPRNFDSFAQIGVNTSVMTFAAQSAGWIEDARSGADKAASAGAAFAQRASEALQRATGVNIDEEMTLMLELERSYQASAKLIGVVDNMLQSLLSAV